MSLTSKQMEALEKQATLFGENDKKFLAQVVNALTRNHDPVDVLLLLHSLWNTAAASRPHEKDALTRVGRWLEGKLRQEPGQSLESLRLEVGWLKRLAHIHAKAARTAHHPHPNPPKEPDFGLRIDDLRKRRAQALQSPAHATNQPHAQAAPQPSAVPEEVWAPVKVRWNPGPQEIIVENGPQRATAQRAEALTLLESMAPESREKLKKKKELNNAKATIQRSGNQVEILAIEG